jgi:hypothetical protein
MLCQQLASILLAFCWQFAGKRTQAVGLRKITARVPAAISKELQDLKTALPRPYNKTSQDDIVGALIHAAKVATLQAALDPYWDEMPRWVDEEAAEEARANDDQGAE